MAKAYYWFEARPEFQTFNSIVENFSFDSLGATTSPSETAPVVCIIDSGVTAGNPFLQPVVREDLLKSFLKTAPNNPSDDFGHGSGVASLAAYYALNPTPGAENEGKVWIASARILTGENQLEDERLFSSLLREVIQYFAPKGVKIFNLSVNVRNLSWNKNAKRTHPRRSWVARTIDQLSREYDVVFVTSTGNILPPDVRDYHRDGKPYPAYFHEEESCILDPGQAALALTVGSVAPATLAEGPTARARTVAERNQASPFTRCGPGIRDEVKPELTDFGGNYLIDEESGIVRSNRGLGLAVASNKLTPALQYQSGTSFAAPRAAHKLALIFRDLNALEIVPSASLLKAFAVNSARYSLDADELKIFQEAIGSGHWLNIIGYGIPDDLRATYCDAHSVISYYQGEIEPGKIAFIDVPVPENLRSAERGTKRLTVTLVYSPEVQRWGLERYLATSFKWRVFRGDASRDDVIAAMSLGEIEDVAEPAAETDDSVEESSDPKELPFLLGINRRSKGAAQHDVAQWVVHKPEFSAHNYTLAVTAYERWGRTTSSPVPFAVVVRLEETTRSAEIYSEVENAFVQLEVQATSGR